MSDIFNPYVDVVKARRDYRDFKWSRLDDVFIKTFAESLIQDLVKKVEFENVFVLGDEEVAMSDKQLADLSHEQRTQLIEQINSLASEGKGYLYAKKVIDRDSLAWSCKALVQVMEWLNSSSTLELISDITGCSDLSYATCETMRFSKGQFLTNNSIKPDLDCVEVGYMLDLTPDWNTNWGGLLHLNSVYEGSGVTFTPIFNNLILFDANHDLSVSYLASFIKYNRYSLMGWFKT